MTTINATQDEARRYADGSKTAIVLPVKPQPDDSGLHNHDKYPMSLDSDMKGWWGTVDETGEMKQFKCPYSIGQVIAVRESWRILHVNHKLSSGDFFTIQFSDYSVLEHKQIEPLQDELRDKFYSCKYEIGNTGDARGRMNSPVTMPRSAARTFLTVVDIQVKRSEHLTWDEQKEAYKIDGNIWVWVITVIKN